MDFMNDKTKARSDRWFSLVKATLIFAWILLTLLAMLSHAFGYGYVPSTNWAKATGSYCVVAGLIGAVLLVVHAIKNEPIRLNTTFTKLLGIVFAPFFGYFMGSTPILIGVPMLLSLVAGHQVELIYNVARADGIGDRGCYSPIELHDLPFFFNSLCYVPEDLRQAFKPTMLIAVEGRGTSLGVYVRAIHRVGA
jgi:hypothetical protein